MPSQMFRELLLRLRIGKSAEDDWKNLMSRQPTSIDNLHRFDDATRLFYRKKDVADFSHKMLVQLENPIAEINARHSTVYAKNVSSDDMLGLEPVIYLAKGACAMLTCNLWSEVGLCNGVVEEVVDFIFQTGHSPPDLPIAVVAKFYDYTGPSFSDNAPSYIPICPITTSLIYGSTVHERQQLLLRLSWASLFTNLKALP